LKIKFKYVKISTTNKDNEFNKKERKRIKNKNKSKNNEFDKKKYKIVVVFRRIIESRSFNCKTKKVIVVVVRIRLN